MGKQRTSSIPRLAGFFLSFFAAWISTPSYADVVNATAQTLQSSARVNRVEIDYTYTLTIHNTGAAVKNVAGTLTSSSPNTVVMDGAVVITKIGADTTSTGTDTFTIRQNRSYPYNPADLHWSFTFEPDVPANHAPTANAGTDQTVFVGDSVTLDGSASSDVDGNALSFSWSLVSVPAGSAATLSGASSVNPTFVADKSGNYAVQLIVNDGSVNSAPGTVTISTQNSVPVANAGPDQSVVLGSTVQLNGVASSDVDGNLLNFTWSFASRPVGSAATLSSATAVNPTFIADVPGIYIAQLIVNDGAVNSLPDSVTITTDNAAPVANAGVDLSVVLSGTAQLDGAGSSDPEAAPLSYRWSFISRPSGSAALLSATNIVNPIFVADVPGTYVVQLIVNDGVLNSVADTVVVTTLNTVPVANAGPDQNVTTGATVVLDGTASSDADGNALFHVWSFTSVPSSVPTLTNPASPNPSFSTNADGNYVVQLTVNDGTVNSPPDTVMITATASTPIITVAAQDANAAEAGADIGVFRFNRSGNAAALLTVSFTISGTATNGTDYQTITGSVTFASGQSAVDVTVTPIADITVEGAENVVLTLIDGASYDLGASTSALVTIADSVVATYTLGGTLSGLTGTLVLQNNGGNDLALSTNGSFTFATALTNNAAYNVTVLTQPAAQTCAVTNGSGTVNGANVTNVAVNCVTTLPPDPGLPPEPGTVAPPVDRTVASDILATTAFLYTGTNPIQTGVAPGTLELKRVAVLRGKVAGRDGSALSAVKISVLGHPEFGQTLTRADGLFDLAVNGGGQLTVRYEKDGFLAVQRAVIAPWRDYAWLPEIVMIPLDSAVTAINLVASTSIQVARGNPVSDADGARQATILFPPGTTATMVLPNGTTQVLTTLNVRATEYTVGDAGPKAMPAPLPPSSGYTYAAEFSVDEAIAAGASEVRFSQALPVYVENFIGFPVGGAVPTGYYDRQKGQWIASANGRVIKVLSITNGMTDLDLTGSGIAANAAALTALGVTNEERSRLALLYAAGQTLWRVPMTHFTPWDFNWPRSTPTDAISSPQPTKKIPPLNCQSEKNGSVIGCEDQTLGESVPVNGTPWRLHYQSERTPGRKDARSIEIPVSDSTPLPASLRAIRVEVTIAGRLYQQTFTPAPNLSYTVTWDGLDGYGRELQGAQPANVRVHYDYEPQFYAVKSDFENSFARAEAAGVAVSGSRGASSIALSRNWTEPVGASDARAFGLGGWSLEIHHIFDANSGTLLLGDGRHRRAEVMTASVITTMAGTGVAGFTGDGGPATAARLSDLRGVAVGPDGSLFVSDYGNHRIRRIGPDGVITTVAGTGVAGFSGDGGSATAAQLSFPWGVAVGPDGSLFVTDYGNHRIRRIGPDGIMTTVAGTGVLGFSGDGELAIAAQVGYPSGIAVGTDSSLFVSDTFNHRVRRIGQDGIITTVAGSGVQGFSGDGEPATAARLSVPSGVAVGLDGSLFVVDGNRRVRRIGPDGIITTVAGSGVLGFSGDGGLATAARFFSPDGVAVGLDGSLFVADTGNHRIRRIGQDGIITTVTGLNVFNAQGFSGDGGSATAARLSVPRGVAVGPDGTLFISDVGNYRLRRVYSALSDSFGSNNPFPSEDGSELYIFSSNGRHLKTLDALTGALVHQFTYSTDGYLTAVTAASGNVTTVERSGATVTAIVAPGGQRTLLNVGADGWLLSATNPASEAHTMSYSADGLMQTFTGPRGDIHIFTYDALGRLLKDTDPVGGSTTLSRTQQSNGYTVTTTSALGRNHVYQVEQLPTGAQRRTITGASGTKTITLNNADGSKQTSYADGSSATITYGPDPRFGMLAPVASSVVVKTPAGLTRTITTTRTVTLADPNNVLSLTKLTDTVTDNGVVSTRVYTNAATRTLTTTTAVGRSSTVTLDALGRTTQAQALGLDPVSYTYDSRGLLSTITEGSGAASRTTSLAYNAAFELTGLTDPLARTLGLGYDSAGRLVTQTLPDGRTVKFAYDAAGNTTAITPPGRTAHGFDYTPIDQTASYTPPDVGSGSTATQYSYDTDRALTRQTRPDGQLVDVSYDTAGRATSLAIARGAINFSYDATTSKLTGITAPGGLGLSYSYDGDLLKGVTWSGAVAGSTAYTYNNDLRVTAETVNAANSVSYTYDVDGLLKTAGSLALTHNTQNGLRTGSTLGGTLASVTDSLTYNPLAELTNYSASYTGTGIYNASYTHDVLGRITQKVETLGGITTTYGYSYDSASRLSAVTKDGSPFSSYGYDSNGNRIARTGPSVSASYDAQDRLSSYGANTYSYTANGELLSKTNGAGVTSYQYDALGNLLKVTLPSGTVIDYLIDGANRRVGKKVGGTLVQGFLYQGSLRPVAELDNSNTIVSRFVYATHINVPDYMIKGGTTYRIITDQLGSPRLVVDVATGAVAQRIDYDVFGQVLSDTNPGFQPFGFAGGLYDRDTQLVRFGARDYDAETGRWTAKDPIGFEGGDGNLYGYVGGDSINRLDPMGLSWFEDLLKPLVYSPPDPSKLLQDYEKAQANPSGVESCDKDKNLDKLIRQNNNEKKKLETLGNYAGAGGIEILSPPPKSYLDLVKSAAKRFYKYIFGYDVDPHPVGVYP